MKTAVVFFILLLQEGQLFAQTGPSASNPVVPNILKGTYTPSTYAATNAITDPDVVSAGLLNEISVDSLKATLFKMKSFLNRNTFSDTVSGTRGIGAARRWVFNKFRQYSAANDNRLQVSYLQFAYSPASASCNTSFPKRHSNIMAILPGSQTTSKGIILVEGHMDSRNDNNCDVTGNAFGIGDNATGTALVIELARVMSKYTFRNTIVFVVNTGEEQGKIGATATAIYLDSMNIRVKAVNNNDVAGGIFCGHTSSAPSCPGYGALDSTDLRIFSLGGFNSPHKQWARYVKLEYKEQLRNLVDIPMDIQIMQNEDRTGRGGDHQPFSALGYTAVRLTQAYENGDCSNGPGYVDRQHNIRDSLGLDKDHDGVEDSLYINLGYLARNALINSNSMAMVALGPDTITVKSAIITANRFRVQFTPAGAPAYRVAVRSANNDWDTVYTVTGKSVDTIKVPYPTNTIFYLSAAAVDVHNTESQFSTEYTLSTQLVPLSLEPDTLVPVAAAPDQYGIQLMPNRPNPFDESTMITIQSGTDLYTDRTFLNISTINGSLISRIKVPLKKGLNEVLFNHGFPMAPGMYICSLIIDGLPVQSTKMIFRTLK
jgi:hypothetical protein